MPNEVFMEDTPPKFRRAHTRFESSLSILLCLCGETSGHFTFPPPQIFISSKGNSLVALLVYLGEKRAAARRQTLNIKGGNLA
jgi:hypothetical protein